MMTERVPCLPNPLYYSRHGTVWQMRQRWIQRRGPATIALAIRDSSHPCLAQSMQGEGIRGLGASPGNPILLDPSPYKLSRSSQRLPPETGALGSVYAISILSIVWLMTLNRGCLRFNSSDDRGMFTNQTQTRRTLEHGLVMSLYTFPSAAVCSSE